MARPTKMTDEVVAKLEDAFSNGATDIEACFKAGISRDTLYDYIKKNPEFSVRKEDLKDMIKYQAKLNIKERIFHGDIETSKWYAERKIKDEFSPKIETEHSGKIGLSKLLDEIESNPN